MKLRNFGLFALLFIIHGCSSTTVPDPTALDFTQANAQYLANVSDIYGITTISSGVWEGIDVKWKDALGNVRALSDYQGKVVLLCFCRTTPDSAFAEEATLDSVQADLPDSVVVISVAADNTTYSFQTVDSYVVAHNIKHEVIVDSLQRAQVRYVGSSQLGFPETLAIRTNGQIQNNEFIEGWDSRLQLDSLARAAYK